MKIKKMLIWSLIITFTVFVPWLALASGGGDSGDLPFPRTLESYHDGNLQNISAILLNRIIKEPLNLVVTVFFVFAIFHTFLASWFHKKAEEWEKRHTAKKGSVKVNFTGDLVNNVSFGAEFLFLLGEIEVIFGLWVIPTFWAIVFVYGWDASVAYMSQVNFTEPMFVVIIMTLASTRPILQLVEKSLNRVAKIGNDSSAIWWFTILTIGPILGSFITEPGAMTISALLLAKRFYQHKPSLKFAYATLGLLLVNISVGGTLTHFAAPPVLMVASQWDWNLTFMLTNFGWKAVLGILIANIFYFFTFRSEFQQLDDDMEWKSVGKTVEEVPEIKIPAIITIIHLSFLVWTVLTGHNPALFVAGFFVFLGFRKATAFHQSETNLKPALLVGFFLAGLIIHGGLQSWWIAPILGNLSEVPLMLVAIVLTAFNDNAAITFLSSLVPTLTDSMKYAVVAGAVTGGGLTVIANAPNPAGISILKQYFPYGVSPLKLVLGALIPTIILGLTFMLLP